VIAIGQPQTLVVCDPFNGRPRFVRVQDEEWPVLSVERVREETAAYPVETGPRTLFEVRLPRRRARLIFEHWSRRWTVDELEILPALRAA
jgi:hypothetical protein